MIILSRATLINHCCFTRMVNLGKIQTGVSYKKVIIAFAIIALFFVLFILYSTLSQATIKIHPKKIHKDVKLDVLVDSHASKVNFGTQTLPGRILEQTQEVSQMFRVEERDVPAFAKGTVTLINKRGSQQSLVAGSHLRAEESKDANGDPIYFLSDERVVIPGNGSVDVSVTAEQKGAESNIAPQKLIIDRLNSSAWDVVYAESHEPMSGGTILGRIATQEDIDAVKSKLSDFLRDQSITELNTPLPDDEQILPETVHVEILDSTIDVEPDTEVEQFTMSIKQNTTAFVFSRRDLLGLAIEALGDLETENEEYREYREEDFSITLDHLDIEQGVAGFVVELTGTFDVNLSQRALDIEQLLGRNREEVLEYYAEFEHIESVEVDFWPFWVRHVPSWQHNVNIMIE